MGLSHRGRLRKIGLATSAVATFLVFALLSSIAAANQTAPALQADDAVARLKFFHPSPDSPQPFEFRWDTLEPLSSRATSDGLLVLGQGTGYASQPMLAFATLNFDADRSHQYCRGVDCQPADWLPQTTTTTPVRNGAAFANEELDGKVWLGFVGADPERPIFYEDGNEQVHSISVDSSFGIVGLPDATTEFVKAWQRR